MLGGFGQKDRIIGILLIPVFLGSLDLTVVTAFLPQLLIELNVSLGNDGLSTGAWVLTIYLIGYALSLFVAGRLSDHIGRRRTLIVCLCLYLVGAVGVIQYTQIAQWLNIESYYTLLIGRGIQSLGAGAFTAVTLALVSDLFAPEKRRFRLGLVAAVDTVGWLVGAAWGGFVVQTTGDWRVLFVINIVISLVALVVIFRAVPNDTARERNGHFDFLGAALILGALVSSNIFAMQLDDMVVSGAFGLGGIAAGLFGLLTAVFFYHESRHPNPLIDLRIFRQRGIGTASLINALIGFSLYIGLVTLAILSNLIHVDELYVLSVISQDVLNDAARDTGLLIGIFAIPLALATVFADRVIRRLQLVGTMRLGLGLGVLGFIGYGVAVANTPLQQLRPLSGEFYAEIGLILMGLGLGLAFTPLIVLQVNAASDDQRGMASSVVLGVRMFAMSLGVSLLTAYGTHRVNDLVVALERGGLSIIPPDLYPIAYPISFEMATRQMIAELAGLGCIICVLSLVLAYWRLP